jgi:hypothetical protein
MGKKPVIVDLRVYKGTELNYDSNGKVKNENQSIKLFYDSIEWRNQLKNLIANGYIKVEVTSANYYERKVDENGDFLDVLTEYPLIEELVNEVALAFKGNSEVALTPQEARIAELEKQNKEMLEKMNAFMQLNDKKDDGLALDTLKSEYEKLSGKKPHHLWKEEKLIEEIDKLK